MKKPKDYNDQEARRIEYGECLEQNPEEKQRILDSALAAIDPDRMGMIRDQALTLAAAMKNCGYSRTDFAEVMARSSQDKGTFAKQWDKIRGHGTHGIGTEGTIFDYALKSGWKWPALNRTRKSKTEPKAPARPKLLAKDNQDFKLVCIIDQVQYKEKPARNVRYEIRNREQEHNAPEPITPEQFEQAIISGQSFYPAVYTKVIRETAERSKSEYTTNEQQIFVVDIDNEEHYKDQDGKDHTRRIENPLSIDGALEICKAHEIAPFFIYETFSSKEHREDPAEPYPKFRICFVMDKPMQGSYWGERGLVEMRSWFIDLFGAAADTTTADTGRFFYGTNEPERAFIYGAVLDSNKFVAHLNKTKNESAEGSETPEAVDVIPTDLANATREQLLDTEFIRNALDRCEPSELKHTGEILLDRGRELKGFLITPLKRTINEIIRAKNSEPVTEKITGHTEYEHRILNKPLYIGDNYVSEDGKIYGITRGKEMDELYILCPCMVYPLERLCNLENGTERLTITFYKDGKWIDKTIDKIMVANHSKVVELANFGLPITSVRAKSFVSFMSTLEYMNPDIPRTITSSRFGWNTSAEGKAVFVPYSDKIRFDSAEEYKDLANALKPKGSKEQWFDLVKKIRSRTPLQYMPQLFMSISLASVLLRPLRLLPFIANIWGLTGRGKTAVLKLSTSIWGNPAEGKYIVDGDTTHTALFIKASALNSLPLCIDDFSKVNFKKMGMEALIYTLCSGTDRATATKERHMQKTNTWCNSIITTFERPMIDENMKGGAINRVLDFEAKNEDIFENFAEVFDTMEKNYGFFGRMFVEKVLEIGPAKLSEMRKDFEQKIRAAAADLGEQKETKQIIPLSVILTADKIAAEIFQDGMLLDVKELARHLKGVREVSDGQRAYEYIIDFIATHSRNFINLDRTDLNQELPYTSSYDVFGYLGKSTTKKDDKGNYQQYVFVNGLQLRTVLDGTEYNTKVLLNWLSENNLIQPAAKGFMVSKKIFGNVQKVYAIKLPHLKEDESAEV